MGGRIVLHSFRMLFANLGNALRISIGPYLIGFALAYAALAAAGVPLLAMVGPDANPEAIVASPGPVLAAVLVAIAVIMFVSSWVAVGWHRYVLLEEYPGLLPALSGRPVGAYVWRAILLGLVMILVSIPLGLVSGLVLASVIGPGAPSASTVVTLLVVGVIIGTILTYVSLRLGLILPAVAVDQPMTMGESWGRTAPLSGAIFAAVLILTALNIGAGTLLEYVLGGGNVAAVLGLAVDWISLMVGISILTTLYGLIVEGRQIG